MSDPSHIIVRNARVHNLRGVDVDLPRNAMVVFTGVSGSGKSSLAFDTLFKEGQRRFMESLSAYARQFLGRMERPEVDLVEGISPTLSIDQKTVNRNPRSTVGTITEVYDHLRLLMARLGEPRCPICEAPIDRLGLDQVVDRVLQDGEDQVVHVLAPVVQERKGEYRKVLEDLARDGWVRVRIDGVLVRIDEAPELERYKKHTIEVVVDRLKVTRAERGRLSEAVESALQLGEQVVTVVIGEQERTYSTRRACVDHPDQAVPELEPRLFSFNSPQGACPTCTGLGALEQFEVELVLDETLPLPGAVRVLGEQGKVPFAKVEADDLIEVGRALGADVRRPVGQWTAGQLQGLLFGREGVSTPHRSEYGPSGRRRAWDGLIPLLDRVWHYTKFPALQRFRSTRTCPDCQGARLAPIPRAVRFRGRGAHELSAMTVADAAAFFEAVELGEEEQEIGALLISEVCERLRFLVEVGVGYLSLSRSAATLSGGESQRIRLASQVGSGLQGVTYVLDEPSIGLHPRDNDRLLDAMRRLRDRGNTLLIVEHDADTVLAADYVVDVGPGAGREGGFITAVGTPAEFLRSDCLTAQYLRGERRIPVPTRRREGNGQRLTIRGATANNLKSVDVELPLGALTVVTGVSGSGKSSLVFQVLERSLSRALEGERGVVGCAQVGGLEHIDKLVHISQRPIGRTPRSNPATYVGVMDLVRDLFAATPEAEARGYDKGRFSFNVEGGRCEDCGGAGVKTVEMQFLPDVDVPCESCGGRRFNKETLDIRWKGHTIADVLDLPIGEAAELFANQPKLARVLRTLVEVGLDYVTLGQPTTTLSGGEAQRVKLATELHRPSTGKTLYLLDEPTTGLHVHDVGKLLIALDQLVEQGNTVVVVEHHLDLVKCADHVIDLGPEGGDAGGQIVGVGTPEHLATLDTPTGRALRESGELAESPRVYLAADAPVLVRERSTPTHLRLRGASKHNLREVDVDVPLGALTVVTGVSGSGKTSLAFDTVFSEGQRRYVESLSTYARRFLGRMERAPLRSVEGLQPAIAIDQRTASHNPRSTVGTVTEVHDVLRLLYARVGVPHCPHCGVVLRAESPSRVARRLAEAGVGAGWVLARLPADTAPAERRGLLVRDGWLRLWQAGTPPVEIELAAQPEQSERALAEGAWLVVDRLRPASDAGGRLAEAVAHAYRLGGGVVRFVPREGEAQSFTEGLHCAEHGAILPELTPRHFSFNARIGMCEACEGLGTVQRVAPDHLFGAQGGLWEALDARVVELVRRSELVRATLETLVRAHGAQVEQPVSGWPAGLREEVLYGRAAPLKVSWSDRRKVAKVELARWDGLLSFLAGTGEALGWVTVERRCEVCGGGRLGAPMLAVTLGGQNLHAFTAQTVEQAIEAVAGWQFDQEATKVAARARLELERRLGFLRDVGLAYLALDRPAASLSGGEAQRIRLASQLGSALTGVTYVLDEPTVGLHPRDTARLLDTLEGLRDQGNTLLVVEHDPETLWRADHVIDMGPAAGRHGGQVVATGTPAQIAANEGSVTGAWLAGRRTMPARPAPRRASGALVLRGARAHNLRVEQVEVPLGVWTAVTGVSGSGKSSLIMDTLVPALSLRMGLGGTPGPYDALEVNGALDGLVVVDQSPIGRTPRSTPATYSGLMDALRKLFAQTAGAQARGWTAGRFSFNAAGGRCEHCEGRGATLIEMHFLPDVWVTCDVCKGRRFNRDTLDVRWKGHSIADVLAMRADEALELFSAQRALRDRLKALVDVGLDYMTLGQPGTTLSGGEAQRVKLAAELVSRKGRRLYVLDEPTTGLHLSDVEKLVEVLQALVQQGHSVVTIEHHLDMVEQADWVIEVGPEGGAAGGRVIATGTPATLAGTRTPTGLALAAHAARAHDRSPAG